MEDLNGNQLNLPRWEDSPTLKETGTPPLDLSANWLDYSLLYPEPRYLLEYGGVPFAPLGGIQAITGQKKNGKTFLMCQFMSAILAEDSERMRAQLPGLMLHDATAESLTKKPVVLYIDTEMEKLNTVKVVRRVQWLCNWDFDKVNEQLRVLWLRAEESNAIRWAKTKQAIIETRPTAIFLDGIRDVIGDFNDNEESANLIAECMMIATELDCCIFSVLHENPGSEKMRGHLGTELANKVSDTFECKKEKANGMVTFTVKQVDARGKDVPDWKFEIVDDAGALGVPRMMDNAQAKPVSTKSNGLNDEEWVVIVKAMKQVINPPRSISFTDLRSGLKLILHRGNEKLKEFIMLAESKDILINQNGKYLFNISEGNAVIQGTPF